MDAWNEEYSLKFGFNSRIHGRTEAIQEYLRSIFSVVAEITIY